MTSVPPGLRRATRYIPEVESLRGIAILLVVFHHADGLLTPHLAQGGVSVSPLRAFVAGGQSGVSLFFVLSAFCLSLPFYSRTDNVTNFSLLRFYERRALRILPLYWAVTLAAVVLSAHQLSDLRTFIPYAFFLNSFPGVVKALPPYTNVYWSLATEVQFYCLLPLLPLALSSRYGFWTSAAVVATYAGWFCAYLLGSFSTGSVLGEIHLGISVLGRGPVFLAGILVAWIYARFGTAITHAMSSRALLRSGGGDLLLLAVLAGLGFMLQWQVGVGFWNAENREYFAWHIAEGILWASLLLVLLVAPLRTKALFCNPALSQAGVWSYSIYLLHLPVLMFPFLKLRALYPGQFAVWDASSTALVAALTVVCIALSACTYRWIESPFLQRKARLDN